MDSVTKGRIKNVVTSVGWDEVAGLFRQEIEDLGKPKYLKTDGKSNEQIVTEVKAYEMAAKLVKKVLRKVEKCASETEKKDIPYR